MFSVIPAILFFFVFAGQQEIEIKLPDLLATSDNMHDDSAIKAEIISDSQRGTADGQFRGMTGKWQLSWNDQIDIASSNFPHGCSLEFHEIDNLISGKFIGPVAGTNRNAIISGRVEGQQPSRLLTFQQREKGYVCSYQAIDNGAAIIGVWHDTKNRSGTFRLLRQQ